MFLDDWIFEILTMTNSFINIITEMIIIMMRMMIDDVGASSVQWIGEDSSGAGSKLGCYQVSGTGRVVGQCSCCYRLVRWCGGNDSCHRPRFLSFIMNNSVRLVTRNKRDITTGGITEHLQQLLQPTGGSRTLHHPATAMNIEEIIWKQQRWETATLALNKFVKLFFIQKEL